MGVYGVTGENRTLVGWFTASRLNHSATATSGGSRENRTLITGLQDQGSPIELPTRTLLTQNGAESGSPTQLCSLEDCHLRRSVNPAYGAARQNRTGLAALPKQFIAINDWAERNGSGSENRTRVAALRVQCSAA